MSNSYVIIRNIYKLQFWTFIIHPYVILNIYLLFLCYNLDIYELSLCYNLEIFWLSHSYGPIWIRNLSGTSNVLLYCQHIFAVALCFSRHVLCPSCTVSLTRWPETGQMVSCPIYSETSTSPRTGRKDVASFLTVTWMLFGSKTWTLWWMTIRSLHWRAVKELDCKTTVLFYLR